MPDPGLSMKVTLLGGYPAEIGYSILTTKLRRDLFNNFITMIACLWDDLSTDYKSIMEEEKELILALELSEKMAI